MLSRWETHPEGKEIGGEERKSAPLGRDGKKKLGYYKRNDQVRENERLLAIDYEEWGKRSKKKREGTLPDE